MFKTGNFNITEKNRGFALFEELNKINKTNDWQFVLSSMRMIKLINNAKIFRADLWYGLYEVVSEKNISDNNTPLDQIALQIKATERIFGRKLAKRLVSRTLLITGLEFDHAIILDADVLNAKELYVAMTRGTKSLTILSSSQVLKKELPKDLFQPKKIILPLNLRLLYITTNSAL